MTDAEYLAWLANDNRERIVLVEAVCYSSGTLVTRYLSNGAFVSTPTDTPANTAYDDIIISIPTFTREMGEQLSGQTTQSWGDIDVANEGGVRDSWLEDAWDGRALRLYLGAPDWPKADFRLIADGISADLTARDQTTLSLKLRDKQELLNVQLQTALIGGSDANKDQPKPLCFGQCFNVEPVLVESLLHHYQLHDGPINAITAIYDNGLSVGTAGVCGVAGVGFVADLANGGFSLCQSPSGRITADVQGAKPGGVYLTQCADIAQHLILNHSVLGSGDIDAASITAMNAICPQPLGLYIGSRSNLLQELDDLVISVGGFYGFSRDGKFQLGRLAAPAGTPVLLLDEDDIQERGLNVERRMLPRASVRLGYRKNWTVQPDGLAGAVSEARRADLSTEQRVASFADPAIKTVHLLALDPDLQPTLLVNQADAAAEAARLGSLYGQVRSVFIAQSFTAPYQVNIGNVVLLTHTRFGFASGRLAVVVKIAEEPTLNRVELGLFL